MNKNSLTILGSSSGLPQADRATSGYLLKTGESLSLIDCGGGVTSSFLKRGFNPLDVERVFISHTHSDHVCELPLFIQLIYLEGRQKPFDLYLPSEFVAPFKDYLKAVYLIVEKLPFEIKISGYESGFEFNGNFRLHALGNKHLLGHKELINELKLPNKMQCHSFEIDVAGKTIFYSSDIASFGDAKDYLNGKDIVLIESTHIDLDEFFEFAKKINVGRYVITHLGNKDEVAEINQRANKAGINNLVTAIDGMEIKL